MTREHTDQHGSPAALDAVARLFAARDWPRTEHGAQALADARARADRALVAAGCGTHGPAELILAPFAGALLVELAADHASRADGAPAHEELAGVAGELAELGLVPLALLREALRAPAVHALEPARACELALIVLAACAHLRHVSLWAPQGNGRVVYVAGAGAGSASPPARRLASKTISGQGPPGAPAGEMHALALVCAGGAVGALVARRRGGSRERVEALLGEVCPPLAALLERRSLLASSAAGERMLLSASERRLTRLGFDLHDGPLQELLLVGEDLGLFRRQLAVVLEGRRGKELLGGRLDDLDARLVALERGLRRISSAVHSDVRVGQPFADALRDLVEPFAARTGVQPALACKGDLESISTSQRLAVLGVVGEALNNVREHGEASSVEVTIALDRDGLSARVRDDGRGFDVESELLRAARSGHMGLAGMHERVRLLDGQCRVESRPGGPTEVTLTLPHWRPVAAGAHDAAAS